MENEVKNLDINFVSGLAYAPLLKYSPVENLISGYYPGKIQIGTKVSKLTLTVFIITTNTLQIISQFIRLFIMLYSLVL